MNKTEIQYNTIHSAKDNKNSKFGPEMKTRLILLFFTALMLTSCFDIFHDEIYGHAIIVDNFKDKNPLEGVYVEVEHTEDEGYNYYVIGSDTTDENGYFSLDLKFESAIFTIDAWSIAYVYSDTAYTDTLGYFSFQFAEDTYRYQTIHLDTFTLSHNIWIKPRIRDLGDCQADEITIDYFNCELIDASLKNMTFSGAVDTNQTFDPVEIKMSMLLQHWLTYGSRDLARGSLRKDSQEIGFGYFKLEEFKHTSEGDTLYLNFNVVEDR